MNALAPIFADIQEPRAFRRTNPFVQIGREVRRSDGPQVQRNHSRRVRAVDQRVHAARVQLCDDPLNGENDPGLTGDVVDEQQPGLRRDGADNPIKYDIWRANGKGNVDDFHLGAASPSDVVERVPAGVVLMVGDQQLVVG